MHNATAHQWCARLYRRSLAQSPVTRMRNKFSVKYQVGGEARFVNYTLNGDSTVKFEFMGCAGEVTTEIHPRTRQPSARRWWQQRQKG